MRALIRKATIVLIGIMVCFCVGYLGLALYYRDGFAVNTWINGVYCTGKDVETVNRELVENTRLPESLTVYGKADEDGSRAMWELPLSEMGTSVDYTVSLQNYLGEQNPLLWVDNLTLHREHTIVPEIRYDGGTLQSWFEDTFRQAEESYCYLEYSDDAGYTLMENLIDRLDAELAYAAVLEAIGQGAESVDLAEKGCYTDLPPTAEQEQTIALWERIETYQSSGPVYDLGDGAWQMPAGDMAGLLVKDEETNLPIMDDDGNLQILEDAPETYIEALAQEHDTYQKTWEFTNTAGETVSVQGVTYGTSLDQETENAWLADYLAQLLGAERTASDGTADEPHIPTYTREAYCRSCETLGDTYIEVDMGRQKLYYYQEGELLIETDVVTGNVRSGRRTPEGVNFVYNKQTDRVLRGEGYASPVDYWMPVKGAIGIHDADWRSEFGGDIYLTAGSHGCINVPPKVMPELYELVEIGTPVVMFY